MRVLITGAGEIGYRLAETMAAEHDVTLIDKDIAALSRLEGMDLKLREGNAANARLLEELDVEDMDLVMAVTGSDEINIITCIIASRMGVTHTIARVRNPEYIDQPVKPLKELGIEYMICPELVMVEDLASTISFPAALMNRRLAGGMLELIELKVSEEMPLVGQVGDLKIPRGSKIVAVKSNGKVRLGDPNITVKPNDHVTMLIDPRSVADLRQSIHENARDEKAVIVGGGLVGFYLAQRLEKMGIDLKLIEIDNQRCREISTYLSDTMILNGDGTDISLLTEEGVGDADVVFAVTGIDEKNLLSSLLSRQLGAKKIISRANRSYYVKLFERVGIDRAVSPGQVTADAVLWLAMGSEEMVTLSDEGMTLMDFAVRANSRLVDKHLMKELPSGAIAGMILRNGLPLVPDEQTILEEGDRVFVVSYQSSVSRVKKIFAS